MTKRRTPTASAFTLVELLVVLAVLAAFVLFVTLVFAKAKNKARRITCVSNLVVNGLAFRIWANDNLNVYPMGASTNSGGPKENNQIAEVFRHFRVMSNELASPRVLTCPADTRRPATSWTSLANSNISYFVGLDADPTTPQMFLSGDTNLELDGKPVGPGIMNLYSNSVVGWTAERHGPQGNAALTDGSVRQYSNARLREALAQTGVGTNRLAMP
jgi:prepilin-type N-terminal cleavage/methylation domain-containing protein